MSSLGVVRYKRRIYQDERDRLVKPVDELLGLLRYGQMSGRVQEMGAALSSSDPDRRAADQLSCLIKAPINTTSLQRMAWLVGSRNADGEEAKCNRIFEGGEVLEGGKIPAPVLYGESNGVWVHLR